MTRMYRAVITISHPVMRPWSRLSVRGLELCPRPARRCWSRTTTATGIPIAIGVAARCAAPGPRAVEVDDLEVPADRSGDERHGPHPDRARQGRRSRDGRGDPAAAGGVCIGIFPEGTRSLGRELRARSGAGRLALAVPEAKVVLCRVRGTTDVVRVPKRPDVDVEFFLPAGGPPRPDETRRRTSACAGWPNCAPGRRPPSPDGSGRRSKFRARLSPSGACRRRGARGRRRAARP